MQDFDVEIPDGKDIMVPMTSSLYVVGKLAEADTVLCDIGTGYYVEKSPAEADDYLKRKTEYLDNNCERLEQNIQEKRKNLEAITMVMQAKARAQAEGKAPVGAHQSLGLVARLGRDCVEERVGDISCNDIDAAVLGLPILEAQHTRDRTESGRIVRRRVEV